MAASLCGERAEGARVARACLESPPPDSQPDILQSLRVALGRLEWHLGRREAAETAYRAAVAAAPEDPWARLHLGELLRATGRSREAIEHLEGARSLPPWGTRVPVPLAGLRRAAGRELGEALEGIGRPADAVPVYEEVLADSPADPETHRRLARALLASGEDEESARGLMALRRGEIAAVNGRADLARPLLTTALEIFDGRLRRNGPDPTGIVRLARAYEALGEPAAARLGYEEALAVAPGHPEALRRLESLAEGATPAGV
jgi:predicted Zn-dependent protease